MIRARAAAKVNLALDVLSRRADGYHEVDMVMQSVSLYDELTFAPADSVTLSVRGDAPSDGSNLVLRAAQMLREVTGCTKGASIALDKRIPTAAGLAGGSADAAAALVGLRALWQLDVTTEELQAMGATLGADIPFCVVGGTMRARGIGTRLSPLPSPPPMALLLDKPCEGIATRDVYGGLRLRECTRHPDIDAVAGALGAGDLTALCASIGNILETVTCSKRPEVRDAIKRMLHCGATGSGMSGSGPTVFGVFPDENSAALARTAYGRGILCIPVPHGVQIMSD